MMIQIIIFYLKNNFFFILPFNNELIEIKICNFLPVKLQLKKIKNKK
jgi:hypothetical protein